MGHVHVVFGRLGPDLLLRELARERAQLALLVRKRERDPARDTLLDRSHNLRLDVRLTSQSKSYVRPKRLANPCFGPRQVSVGDTSREAMAGDCPPMSGAGISAAEPIGPLAEAGLAGPGKREHARDVHVELAAPGDGNEGANGPVCVHAAGK